MQSTLTERFAPAISEMEKVLAEIEEKVVTGYSLADAMREGSKVTTQEYGWGQESNACALSAACVAATARGYSL